MQKKKLLIVGTIVLFILIALNFKDISYSLANIRQLKVAGYKMNDQLESSFRNYNTHIWLGNEGIYIRLRTPSDLVHVYYPDGRIRRVKLEGVNLFEIYDINVGDVTVKLEGKPLTSYYVDVEGTKILTLDLDMIHSWENQIVWYNNQTMERKVLVDSYAGSFLRFNDVGVTFTRILDESTNKRQIYLYEYETGNERIIAEGERLIHFPVHNGIVYIDMPYDYEGQIGRFYFYDLTNDSRHLFMERDASLSYYMVAANEESFYYIDHENILWRVEISDGEHAVLQKDVELMAVYGDYIYTCHVETNMLMRVNAITGDSNEICPIKTDGYGFNRDEILIFNTDVLYLFDVNGGLFEVDQTGDTSPVLIYNFNWLNARWR